MFLLTYIQLSAFTTFTFMSIILHCFTKSAIVLNVNNFLYIYQLSDYRIIQKLIIRFSISLHFFCNILKIMIRNLSKKMAIGYLKTL